MCHVILEPPLVQVGFFVQARDEMLLRVDVHSKVAERVRGKNLKDFGLDERSFQDILYHSLDKLIPDDELLLLMQSRRWQEEPDLMALDRDGKLYIFELKAWESRSENILQVLRYGQIFGRHKYENLNRLYKKFEHKEQSLKEAHAAIFGNDLAEEKFNHAQVFVVVTNGIDHKTREAIQYWREQGLDVRPWIYRVYKGPNSEMLLEISTFSSRDNPYEDIAEGYYILNTNINNSREDHESMLREKIAAAYFSPWKHKIKSLSKGDVVFLYQSGVGIVAVGKASGTLKIRNYQNNPDYVDEEYYMKLNSFFRVETPISASEIKDITGVNHRFRSTMFALAAEGGRKLFKEAEKRKA
ncbi:MAG: hypothetical protein D6732_04025 [Methanobacteriota archaeon]|nr:MAG: hypothetical protein D6732_04025 [Euryarchaeota archaeon]